MGTFVAACVLFLGLHLGVSSTPLRGVLVRKVGENAYRGLFALAALGLLIWICRGYGAAYVRADNVFLFDPPQSCRDFALPVVGVAMLLAVPGFLMANPTSSGQQGASLRGMQRITRHPFLWGVVLWAGVHLGGAGDLATTILFATFLILALSGTVLIDGRCRERLGADAWGRLAAQSSNIPFGAIMAGRARFSACETFDWRFAVALVVVLGFLGAHTYLFGLSPFPNGWVPGF